MQPILFSAGAQEIRPGVYTHPNGDETTRYACLRAHHSIHGHLHLSGLEHGVLLLPGISHHLLRYAPISTAMNSTRLMSQPSGVYGFDVEKTSLTYIPSTSQPLTSMKNPILT